MFLSKFEPETYSDIGAPHIFETKSDISELCLYRIYKNIIYYYFNTEIVSENLFVSTIRPGQVE